MANIIAYLQKSFASFGSSIILPLGMIAYELAKCAKSNTYVETLGEHADTLHLWIKKGYEEDFSPWEHDIFLGENFLVTVHDQENAVVNQVRERVERNPAVAVKSGPRPSCG